MSNTKNKIVEKQENSQTAKNKHAGNADPRNKEKAKNFKVLDKDGGLPDLPYSNEPGGGSLEGTVGIGT